MRHRAALLLLTATGCLHGGFHHFAFPSSAFHAASAATRAASAATAVAAVPRFHVAPIAVATADLASDILSIGANVAAMEPDQPAPAELPPPTEEEEGTPYRELRWASSATALASGGTCPGFSDVATEGAILFRNAPVTFYVLSNEPLDVTVAVTGSVQWSRNGVALTLTPAGRLGGTAHVEVIDNASQMRIALDLPTVDADAPCQQGRRPLGQ
jgi:hypothetical protein